METTIRKILKPTEILNLFENQTDKVNIRYFEIVDKISQNEIIPNNVYTYNVKVRHSENENPNKVFNKALKFIRQAKRNIVKTNSNNVYKLSSLRKEEKISLGLIRQELMRKLNTHDLTVIDQYIIPMYNKQTNSVYFVSEESYSNDERCIIK